MQLKPSVYLAFKDIIGIGNARWLTWWFDYYRKILNINRNINENYFIDNFFYENRDKTFSMITTNENNDRIKKNAEYLYIHKKNIEFKVSGRQVIYCAFLFRLGLALSFAARDLL